MVFSYNVITYIQGYECNYFLRIETREEITFRVFKAGSKTEFTNNSLNSPKIGKLNIDTKIIPQGLLIHEKTQTKKSHATVPLNWCYSPRISHLCSKRHLHIMLTALKKRNEKNGKFRTIFQLFQLFSAL